MPNKICKVKGCRMVHHAKGYCRTHYLRVYNHGNLELRKNTDGLATAHKSEHDTYANMKARCYNQNCKEYRWYGGRGIKICDRWLGPYGFKHFLEDMGERPKGRYGKHCKYTLDRIDVDGDYCPENCRWADWHIQAANRTSNVATTGVNKFGAKWRARLVVKGKEYGRVCSTMQEATLERKKLERKFLANAESMS